MKTSVKKIVKGTVIGFILFLVLSIVGGYAFMQYKLQPPPNYVTITKGKTEINIVWEGNEFNNKAAMFAPITFSSVPDTFYMQVDLGAVSTLLYQKTITAVQKKYPSFLIEISKEDTTHLSNVSFKVGNLTTSLSKVKTINYGHDIDWESDSSSQMKIIGTLGSDFFHRKKAIINFKEGFIKVADKKQELTTQPLNLSSIEIKHRWVLLPVEIENEKVDMIWDTGASPFALITDKSTWEELVTDKTDFKKNQMNSWGRKVTAFRGKTDKKIKIANSEFEIKEVTYMEGFPFFIQAMMYATGMKGMLGNNILDNQVIYLDLQEKQIGFL